MTDNRTEQLFELVKGYKATPLEDDVLERILSGMREHSRLRDDAAPDWERRAAFHRYKATEDEAAEAFGKLNGWRPSDRCFGPKDLGRVSRSYFSAGGWLDHGRYFKARRTDGKRGWLNTAIVGQPYGGAFGSSMDHLRVLIRAGFQLSVPPEPFASIWYPGATLFLVLTLPGVEVKWLPEQLSVNDSFGSGEWREKVLPGIAELLEVEVGCDRDKVEWVGGTLVAKRDDSWLKGLGGLE